jgi:hypothetical protein
VVGETVGAPLPNGNVWREIAWWALAHGEGEHDWAVMAKDQARASGLEHFGFRTHSLRTGKNTGKSAHGVSRASVRCVIS